MKPIVRVTQIEAFRRYVSGACEYVTEQGVVDSISGVFEGNEYTRIGTAFHEIVEKGNLGEREGRGERHYTRYGKDVAEEVPCGWKFAVEGHSVIMDDAQVDVAIGYRDDFPCALHETRENKDYGDAIVTGCADMIDGLVIHDIKTKYSPVNDADYLDSCQWRYYLELFEADEFAYDIFAFEGYNKDRHGEDVRGLPLTRVQPPIVCYRYNAMEHENRELLGRFLEWAERRGLLPYLTGKSI